MWYVAAIIILFFKYHIVHHIIWDPQTRNGGWVGAWAQAGFLEHISVHSWCFYAWNVLWKNVVTGRNIYIAFVRASLYTRSISNKCIHRTCPIPWNEPKGHPSQCSTGQMSSKSTLMTIRGWNRSKPGASPLKTLKNVADTSSSYASHKVNNFEVIQRFCDNLHTRLQTRRMPIQYFRNHSPCARLSSAWGIVVLWS